MHQDSSLFWHLGEGMMCRVHVFFFVPFSLDLLARVPLPGPLTILIFTEVHITMTKSQFVKWPDQKTLKSMYHKPSKIQDEALADTSGNE